MPVSESSIQRTLGRFEGRFDILDAAIKHVSERVIAHDVKAEASQASLRKLVEDKAEGLADDINQLGVRVVDLEAAERGHTGEQKLLSDHSAALQRLLDRENQQSGADGVKAKLVAVAMKVAPYLAGAGLAAIGSIAAKMAQ